MKKKHLLLLLTLCLLPLSRLQAQYHTHTANGKIWTYYLIGNTATIVSATNTDGTQASGELNVPSQIGTAKVTTINYGAFRNHTNITKITANSVTTIGGSVFDQCTGLTGKLELPNVMTLGRGAFRYCRGLTGLELPKLTTIGEAAFYD